MQGGRENGASKKNRGYMAPEQQRQEENGRWRHRQPPTDKTDKQRAAKFQIFFGSMTGTAATPAQCAISPF